MDSFTRHNIITIIIGIFILYIMNETIKIEHVYYGKTTIKTSTIGYDGRNITVTVDWDVHYKYNYFAPIRKKTIENTISNQLDKTIKICYYGRSLSHIIENHLILTNIVFSFHNEGKGIKYEVHPNMIFTYDHVTFDEYMVIKNKLKNQK